MQQRHTGARQHEALRCIGTKAAAATAPVDLNPGDTLRVTCTHDATLRRQLPALSKLPPRYVVWGDGSSDEMCLGLLSATVGE
jgi:hypothetical protein